MNNLGSLQQHTQDGTAHNVYKDRKKVDGKVCSDGDRDTIWNKAPAQSSSEKEVIVSHQQKAREDSVLVRQVVLEKADFTSTSVPLVNAEDIPLPIEDSQEIAFFNFPLSPEEIPLPPATIEEILPPFVVALVLGFVGNITRPDRTRVLAPVLRLRGGARGSKRRYEYSSEESSDGASESEEDQAHSRSTRSSRNSRSRRGSRPDASTDLPKITWTVGGWMNQRIWAEPSSGGTRMLVSIKTIPILSQHFDQVKSDLKLSLDDLETSHVGESSSITQNDLNAEVHKIANKLDPSQAISASLPSIPTVSIVGRGRFLQIQKTNLRPPANVKFEHIVDLPDAATRFASLCQNYQLTAGTISIFQQGSVKEKSTVCALLSAWAAANKGGAASSSDFAQTYDAELRNYYTEDRLYSLDCSIATFSASYVTDQRGLSNLYYKISVAVPEGSDNVVVELVNAALVDEDDALEWFEKVLVETQKRPATPSSTIVSLLRSAKPRDGLYVVFQKISACKIAIARRSSGLARSGNGRFVDVSMTKAIREELQAKIVLRPGTNIEEVHDGYTGRVLFSAPKVAVAVAHSPESYDILPNDDVRHLSVDGVWQVVFKPSGTGKEAFYHVEGNCVLTTRLLNFLKHRYPLPIFWLTLALCFISKRFRDYFGQIDHQAHKIVLRLHRLIKLIYLCWWIPCEHYQRARMTLEAYVVSRDSMEMVMRELGMKFASAFSDIKSSQTGIADFDDVEKIYEQEKEAFDAHSDAHGVWTVRPGLASNFSVSNFQREKMLRISQRLHGGKLYRFFFNPHWNQTHVFLLLNAFTEILDELNVDFQLNSEGSISLSPAGDDTIDSIFRNFARPSSSSFNKISEYEQYAQCICDYAWSITQGQKLPGVIKVSLMSTHIHSVPFLVPYQSKGPLSTSPSRHDHTVCSDSDSETEEDLHATGFESHSKLTYSTWSSTRSNFGYDAWVCNMAFGAASAEEMEEQISELQNDAELVVKDHWLLSESLSIEQEQLLEKVCNELQEREEGHEGVEI
ncbi:uncharacterized protein JCM6883_003453 [Sporobolomyces salmoneus]|uniref:uncharacterized protein n=1 Tax=Sporobolomyces salmoneus TaxID=183962 RepID=UPI00316B0678